MSKHVTYSGYSRPSQGDKLDAPSFHRNHEPIAEALAPWIEGGAGQALEIGSGSGQHAAAFARRFAHLHWRPSDPAPAHRRSAEAWSAEAGLPNLSPPLDLDVAAETWALGPQGAPAEGFRLILAVNMVQVAPWAAAEGLFRGAGRLLAADGILALYGPFRLPDGAIAESNLAFDAILRRNDPDWGVRAVADLDGLAAQTGLERRALLAAPANNWVLIYGRRADAG